MALFAMKNGKNLIVSQWLHRANQDIKSCFQLEKIEDSEPEIICFHAQQSAEKFLKAFLVLMNEDIPKTHDVEQLVEICCKFDSNFSDFKLPASILTSYAVTVRYADIWMEVPREKALEA